MLNLKNLEITKELMIIVGVVTKNLISLSLIAKFPWSFLYK
jgi:hypothetical protein